MGYFDAFINSLVKTGKDGRKIFYPWGIMGRGYILPSEEDFLRIRKNLIIYFITCFLIMILPAPWLNTIEVAVLAFVLLIPYVIWVYINFHGMEQAAEKLSSSESITNRARALGAPVLWLLEVCAVSFVLWGIYILTHYPHDWLSAACAIVLGGYCAVIFAKMIIINRRH